MVAHAGIESELPPWAMCGRLRVGKSFLVLMHCCWSELPCVRPLMRRSTMAAGHNALRRSGPGQKLALEAPWPKWGVPVRGPTGMGALQVFALSNVVTQISPRVQIPQAGNDARYGSPLAIMAQAIRAILLASATAATLADRRSISFTNQG
jgi:hypothetical protein